MPDTENKNKEGGSSKPAEPSLYNKGDRSSRMRLLNAPSKKKLIPVEIGRSPRRRVTSRHSPFQHILKANLKKLIVVGVLMTLLLLASWEAVNLMGEHGGKARSPTPAPAASNTNATPAAAVLNVASNPAALAPPIDTALFRKAAYLAKKAKAFEDAGDFEKAINNYREALDVLPNTPTVWAQLGRAYLKQKDFWHAQVSLEKAVESNPGSADILNDLGVAYLWQEGKLDRAINMLQTAIDVDPTYAPTYFNRALALLAKNDTQKARESLEQYLRMKADDPRGLREIACIKAREGRRAEALTDLEKAIAQAPDWPLLYFDSAAINALQGQCDTAIRFLEKAEPLSGPAAVFKVWQEPAFRECRLSELGKVFEKKIADDARELINKKETVVPTSSEPIISPPK